MGLCLYILYMHPTQQYSDDKSALFDEGHFHHSSIEIFRDSDTPLNVKEIKNNFQRRHLLVSSPACARRILSRSMYIFGA